jgi:hypothetical protein
VADDRGLGGICLDVYGNHDIWPGTLPAETTEGLVFSEIPEVEAFREPWAAPVDIEVATDLLLRFHLVNSVTADPFKGGLLAMGGVGPHPIPGPWQGAHTAEVVRTIQAAPMPQRAGREFGIALMHHPPHAFDAFWAKAVTLCRLQGAHRFCSAVTGERLPVQLVLAGHRHAFDPGLERDGTPDRCDAGGGHQAPLVAGSGQLVSQSPTVDGYPNALAIYRVFHEPGGDEVTVTRARRTWDLVDGLSAEVDDGEVLTGLRAH